jgi:DNA-binding NarL/FixJ family response regulator
MKPTESFGIESFMLRIGEQNDVISVLLMIIFSPAYFYEGGHNAPRSVLACQLLSDALRRLDDSIEVLACESDSRGFLLRLAECQPDVALISASLYDGSMAGFKVLYEMRSRYPAVCPILVLDTPEKDLIVAAFRTGALGTVFRTDPIALLHKAIRSVYAGQVWANSRQMRYVLEALSTSISPCVLNARGENLLSQRQQQLVSLVAEGLSNREIAVRMHLSEHTVKNYLFRIFEKLGISNRVELIMYSMSQRETLCFSPPAVTTRRQSSLPQRTTSAMNSFSYPLGPGQSKT